VLEGQGYLNRSEGKGGDRSLSHLSGEGKRLGVRNRRKEKVRLGGPADENFQGELRRGKMQKSVTGKTARLEIDDFCGSTIS